MFQRVCSAIGNDPHNHRWYQRGIISPTSRPDDQTNQNDTAAMSFFFFLLFCAKSVLKFWLRQMKGKAAQAENGRDERCKFATQEQPIRNGQTAKRSETARWGKRAGTGKWRSCQPVAWDCRGGQKSFANYPKRETIAKTYAKNYVTGLNTGTDVIVLCKHIGLSDRPTHRLHL